MKTWHIQTWGAGTPHYLVSAKTKEDAWEMVVKEWKKKFNTTFVGRKTSYVLGHEIHVHQDINDLIEIKGLTTPNSLIIDLNETIK